MTATSKQDRAACDRLLQQSHRDAKRALAALAKARRLNLRLPESSESSDDFRLGTAYSGLANAVCILSGEVPGDGKA